MTNSNLLSSRISNDSKLFEKEETVGYDVQLIVWSKRCVTAVISRPRCQNFYRVLNP